MSYEYETIADIIRLSEENNISFGDVVMRSELEQYDRSEKEIVKEIKHRLSILRPPFTMVCVIYSGLNPICLVEMRLV